MLIYFQELILQIILWILRMVEGIFEIYNTLLGMEITSNYEKQDVLLFIIKDSKLLIIFVSIFIITIFISLIFVIISVIKNMIQNNKNISSIISKFFMSIIGTMITFIIMLIVISSCNLLLNLLINNLDINTKINISKLIFDNSVSNYLFDYTISEIDFSLLSPTQIFGDYLKNDCLIPSTWKLNGMVNPNSFSFLPCFITSTIVLISLVISAINIVKRIYKIALLYIALPLSLSTIPLDEGLRFNYWKKELLKQIFLIFSTIFALKIFYLVLPILLNIDIINNISRYSKSLINLFMISSGSTFITSSQYMFNKSFELNNRMEQL